MSAAARTGRYGVRGLDLAYHAWGPPEAQPLLFIHGFQDHGQSFARVIAALEGQYLAIAPDLRGHGESGWVGAGGDYHFYDYFGDMLALVEHLGLETFGLIGHSLGGNIATGFASLVPGRVRALVLLEGMGYIAHDLADTVGRMTRWAQARRRDGLDEDVAGRRRRRPVMADLDEAAARLRRYNARLDWEHARALAASFSEPAESGAGLVWRFDPLHKAPAAKPFLLEEASAYWRALEMPVLSLYGAESPMHPPDLPARHALIRDVRVGTVADAGHNLHHDQPVTVARAIAYWMGGDRTGDLPQGVR